MNIAARVQALAEADEIRVTETVYGAPGVRELVDARTVVAEEARLKGIARAHRVFAIT